MDGDMPAIVAATEGVLVPEALIEDDVGIPPHHRESAIAPFALGSGCYQRSSRILTSNESNPSMKVGVSALRASGHGDRTALSMLAE
jgi:hypothetical protein